MRTKSNLKRSLGAVAFLSFAWALSSGCVNFGGPAEQVIERSKLQEPKWIDFAEGKSHEDSVRITYVSVRSHLQDLPLAVKETQTVTLAESEINLRGRMTKKLSTVATAENINITNVSAFHKIIEEQVKRHHGKYANVTDIYYEKLMGGIAAEDFKEFYKVYVRVDYFKNRLPELLQSISANLIKSPHSDLRLLGQKMTNSFEQLLGH